MQFSPVAKDERARVLATLVSAFMDDPFERWLWPELHLYLTHFPEFLDAVGGGAFDEQTVWALEECSAVALWLPPGAEAEGDAIVHVLAASVSPAKHAEMLAVLEQMDAVQPKVPHWYLPWLGVHADAQGRGLGSRLLAQCLTVVDAARLPAYLESPNPRNISFYERHGFEVTAVAQAGTCPPITLMLRPAVS